MNTTTKKITIAFAILLAFAGFEHGLFETFQGPTPTGSVFISAIGNDMQWWAHGSEDAFTLIPSFLITGICAMCVSIFIIVHSIYFLHKKRATTVLLLLFILLVLTGGGIGFIPFFLVTWAYATRINKPLTWWNKVLIPEIRIKIAHLWPYMLVLAALCWLIAIEIAVFGYYPVKLHPDKLLYVCWTYLLFAMIFINMCYITGIANDLHKKYLSGKC